VTSWKEPFLDLKQKIKPFEAVNLKLFHAVALLPFHDRQKAIEFSDYLEPAYMGQKLVGVIETPTAGAGFHGHFYFGQDRIFNELQKLLSGLHTWMEDVPQGVLPGLSLSQSENQTRHNLAL